MAMGSVGLAHPAQPGPSPAHKKLAVAAAPPGPWALQGGVRAGLWGHRPVLGGLSARDLPTCPSLNPHFGDSQLMWRKAIWRSRQRACTKTPWERQPRHIPVCWPPADQTAQHTPSPARPRASGGAGKLVGLQFLVEVVEAVTWGDSHG